MKPELKALADRIERDSEAPLSADDMAYLEQVNTVDDLNKFDHGNAFLCSLAYDAALALGVSEIQAQVITGDIPAEHAIEIEVYYREGEYLSGYTLHGDNAKLLEKIGIARYVSGWGYHVKDNIVKKLGEKFFYRAAWELAQPAIEAKRISEEVERDHRAKIFAQAASTGKPVVLESYSDECNDPREECDLDQVTVYAMPDGSTKETRSHTW